MPMIRTLERYFRTEENGSTVSREIVGGLTTFATMSYIVFVQPTVLALAGMPFGSVLLATCLSAAAACLLMGVFARYPYALAPGMGENFLFAFTVCGTMGFTWPAGLAIVFVSGLLFLLLSVFGVRETAMAALPECLRNAIGPAIGLFIAFVGLQWGGVIIVSPATMVTLGPLNAGPPLLTLGGVLFIAVLLARGFRTAILAGILATAALAWLTNTIPAPQTSFEFSTETFFSLSFAELLDRWDDALLAIALLFFLDFFDTVGTLVGVSRQAGFLTNGGALPRAGRAFLTDAAATCFGALMGTSTVTTYIESGAGVAAGARTGLAAVVTGLCFLAALALAPIVRLAGQNVGPEYYASLGIDGAQVSMYPAVAPAMIIVGILMMAPLRRVLWEDFTEAAPAFMTLAGMVFGFSIAEGVALGCITYALVKPLAGRPREVHPVLYVLAALLLTRYAFLR